MEQTRTNHKAISTAGIVKPRVLYSRSGDGLPEGPLVVEVLADGTYRVGAYTYLTDRQLIIGLTGHPSARHWTFDRYFRLGRYSRGDSSQGSPIMDLFGSDGLDDAITTAKPYGPRRTSGLVSPNLLTVSGALGVDLKNRAGEVAKLLFAGYGRRIYAWGYDPEDVLQEVYKGLLIRNQGKCPWDPAKSSFGHYVHMVCNCVLLNYHRMMSRRRLVGPTANETEEHLLDTMAGDAGSAEHVNLVTRELGAVLPDGVTQDVYRLLVEGYQCGEIADHLGLNRATVSRTIASIKDTARVWGNERSAT